MEDTIARDYFRAQAYSDLANQRSIEALLNCYCRDVAAPARQLSVVPLAGDNWPRGLYQRAALGGDIGAVLSLQLPELDSQVAIGVKHDSATLNFHYLSAPFYKCAGQGWISVGYRQLANNLLETLARRYRQPFNIDLYRQILDSATVMEQLVSQSAAKSDWGEGPAAYIASEQGLTFGHAFHPAPKSREGFTAEDVQNYSPEAGVAFQLEYMAVRREDLLHASLFEQAADSWIASLAPAGLKVPDGYLAVPLHPWQAGYLRRQTVVESALKAGRLQALGPAGPVFYPTASVRTLYRPEAPYFYKFSLNVRLTNCIRKNAFYELESAVALSQTLQEEFRSLANLFPNTRILFEPAFVSVRFGEASEADNLTLTEGFGLLLREGLAPTLAAGQTPLLAATLFQQDPDGRSPVLEQVSRLALRTGLALANAAQAWFDAYLERILEPILYCYFQRGVVFEPHLQNVVIAVKNDLPQQVLIRDLEGTKLVEKHWPADRLSQMSDRARASVYYDAERSWGRIAYCLLANNLFQAVFHIAGGDRHLEQLLWKRLRQRLAAYQARYGCAESRKRIGGLLAGEPLPYKTNLLTRVFKRADRESQYVPLAHPLGD